MVNNNGYIMVLCNYIQYFVGKQKHSCAAHFLTIQMCDLVVYLPRESHLSDERGRWAVGGSGRRRECVALMPR